MAADKDPYTIERKHSWQLSEEGSELSRTSTMVITANEMNETFTMEEKKEDDEEVQKRIRMSISKVNSELTLFQTINILSGMLINVETSTFAQLMPNFQLC